MKNIYLLALTLVFGSMLHAQTSLIPAADGSFSNGADFPSNGWTVSNSVNNPWFVGNPPGAVAPIAGNRAYISSDAGATVSYLPDNQATNYFWRDITVPAGESKIILTFNWTQQGESTWDIWQVFTAPTTITPIGLATHPGSGNTLVPAGIAGATFIGNGSVLTGVQSATLSLPSSLAGTTFRLIFSWKNETFGIQPPASIDNITLTSSVPTTITSTATGGLFSSPATWVGGVVPISDDAIIADGAIVTVDQVVNIRDLTIGGGNSGTLQWNGTSNAMTVKGNVTINPGGKLHAYTTFGTGQSIFVGGNVTNNGYANLAQASTILSINGSVQGGSLSQTISGSGIFQGNGTAGIIRTMFFNTTGNSVINTAQNLITSNLAHSAGSLNTNGKITIDNTATVFGQPLNTQVANVAVTNMGTAYSTSPVVFGGAVTLWTPSGAATLNTRYFSGNNVYLATTAGTFDPATPPAHTSGSVTNGTVPLLWLGTLGTLGNPFIQTSVTVGTQYFYGNNLYVAVVGGLPSITSPPTHTSGVAASGAASFLFVGSPASVTVNFDAGTGTVRSLNFINPGSGYSSAPTTTFSLNGGTVTTAASASAVVLQSTGGPVNSLGQKSGNSTVTGTININSNQNALAFSGVGSVYTTGGGVNYTVAPTVGFAGPTAINLVTNPGTGYTVAPTIIVSGGTLVSGMALTTSNFIITVANGQVVSVYLNTLTSATYSVPPTLAFSTGSATLGFPASSWPAATAVIGSNGQLTNFTVTNSGYGYIAAPTVGVGPTSGTASGGTFTTVASAPTSRVALYNLSYGYFAPATTNVIINDQSFIPANNKINNLVLNTAAGANVSSNLEIFNSSPLTLTSGSLNLGTRTLTFSHPLYAGTPLGSLATNISGKIIYNSPGGSVTRNFPFDAPFVMTTGTGSLATGSNITSMTASRTAAPTGPVSPSGIPIGTRSYEVVVTPGAVYGTAPIVTLNFNSNDNLAASTDQQSLFVSQATATTGPWTVRSLTSGTGPLLATGTRSTATTAPGPIVPTGDDFYAFTTTFVPPSCTVPTAVATNTVTSNSANVTWTGGAGPFIVEYGLSGFTPGTGATAGTGGTLISSATSPVSLSGLFSNTTYDVYVRQDCTAGALGYSPNSGVVSFVTTLDCTNLQPLSCGVPVTTGNLAQAGGLYSVLACGFATPGREKIYTFTSTFAGTYTLNITSLNGGSGYNDYFFKEATGDCSVNTGWTCIDDLNGVSLTNFTLAANTTYFILVDAESTSGTTNHTFKIDCPVACPAPTALAANTVTNNSANITWTGTGTYILEYGLTGFTPGTGATAGAGGTLINPATSPQAITGLSSNTAYQVYVRQDCTVAGNGYSLNAGPLAFTTTVNPPNCTTNISPADMAMNVSTIPSVTFTWNAAATATSYDLFVGTSVATATLRGNFPGTTGNVTGLLASTTYFWYVVPRIGAAQAVGCSASATSFTTSAVCNPSYSSGCGFGDQLADFVINGEGGTSISQINTTCAAAPYYTDLTATTTVNLAAGKAYAGNFKTNFGSNYLTIWIDFNNNNIFEATERVLSNLNVIASNTITTFSIMIPAGAILGTHKMRVRDVYYGTPPTSPTDACSSYTFGEAKDFSVNIIAVGSAYAVSNSGGGACANVAFTTIDAATNNNAVAVPILDATGALVALVNANGNDLGTMTSAVYRNTSGTVRQIGTGGQRYLDRNITITPATQPTTGNVSVRLFFTAAELAALQAVDPTVFGPFSLNATKVSANCSAAFSGNGTFLPQVGSGAEGSDYFIDINTPSFSTFFIAGGTSVIPVSIEFFRGSKQTAANYLEWKVTCTSAPSVTLVLERSADSRNFRSLDEQNASATRCLQGFNYTDNSPLKGINYYRLKIITPDGAFRYSTIVALSNKEKGFEFVSLAPNPVKNTATLTLTTAYAGKVELSVTDIAGKIVMKQTITVIAGINITDMNFVGLSAGSYNISAITADGEMKTTRFVKL